MPKLLEAVGRAIAKEAPPIGYGVSTGSSSSLVQRPQQDPGLQLEAYSGWVYAAASVRAQAVASVPLHLYVGEDELDEHLFLDLWERPCQIWRGYEWRVVTNLHGLLSGNIYLYRARDGLGVTRELYPLIPSQVRVIPGKERFVDGYEYRVRGGVGIRLEPEDVIHIKRPNPASPYYGMGVVQAAAAAIDVSRYIHEFALATFRNRAIPATWIKLSADTPPGERKKIRNQIEQSFKDVANAGRTLISGSDAIEDIRPLALTPTELSYLAGAEFSRDEVFALFGVHRSMVGMADDINRANAEAGEYVFGKWVVSSDLALWADVVNADILPAYDSRLHAEFENPVPADMAAEAARANAAWVSGAIMRDEYREAIGADAAADEADGQLFSVPFSSTLVPAGAGAGDDGGGAPSAPGAPAPAPAAARKMSVAELTLALQKIYLSVGVVITAEEARAILNREGADLPLSPPEELADEAPARSYVKTLEERKRAARNLPARYIVPLERKLARVARGYFAAQSKRVVGRLRNGARSISGKAPNAFDTRDERKRANALLLAAGAASYAAGLRYLRDLTGLDIEPAGARATIKARATLAATSITSTTEAKLAALIEQMIRDGAGIGELVEAVEGLFNGFDYRADLIGREETSTLFHVATSDGMREAGLEYKAWITAGDERVEEVCGGNEDAGTIPVEDAFPSGDMEPPTGEHMGCRCGLIPLTAAEAGEDVA